MGRGEGVCELFPRGSSHGRLALLGGVERRTASRQHNATADGQEAQGLEHQQKDAQGREGADAYLGLDQQRQQHEHDGLEGQNLRRGERAEGV
jgi:hypothetical protein